MHYYKNYYKIFNALLQKIALLKNALLKKIFNLLI